MADRTYLITLNLFDPKLDLEGFKAFVQTSKLFENWWNHIPGTFLVVSGQDAAAISAAVAPFAHGAPFLVIETNPDESEGLLSEPGWAWLRRSSQERATKSAAE